MNLLSFQRAFQAAILEPEEPRASTLDFVTEPRRIERTTAFGVYYHGYRLRLAEFISNDYPVLRHHLGEEAFGRLVEAYVMANPSRSRNARWYASALPEYMESSQPWSVDRGACDLAHFERALGNAFDAADAPALDAQMLNEIEAALWPNVGFVFHPAAMILDLEPGTVARYESCEREGPARPTQDEKENVLVWRQHQAIFYRILDADERLALTEAKDGKRFAEVCSLLSFKLNGKDIGALVGGFLSAWFADGLITQIRVDD